MIKRIYLLNKNWVSWSRDAARPSSWLSRSSRHDGPVRSAFCPSIVVLTEMFLYRGCFWGEFSNDWRCNHICLTVYTKGHRGPRGPYGGERTRWERQ